MKKNIIINGNIQTKDLQSICKCCNKKVNYIFKFNYNIFDSNIKTGEEVNTDILKNICEHNEYLIKINTNNICLSCYKKILGKIIITAKRELLKNNIKDVL